MQLAIFIDDNANFRQENKKTIVLSSNFNLNLNFITTKNVAIVCTDLNS